MMFCEYFQIDPAMVVNYRNEASEGDPTFSMQSQTSNWKAQREELIHIISHFIIQETQQTKKNDDQMSQRSGGGGERRPASSLRQSLQNLGRLDNPYNDMNEDLSDGGKTSVLSSKYKKSSAYCNPSEDCRSSKMNLELDAHLFNLQERLIVEKQDR